MAEPNTKKKDPAWKHASLSNPNDPNTVTCIYCMKVTKGGIHRHKLHLIGGNRNVKMCLKCPSAVRQELKDYEDKKRKQKMDYQLPEFADFDPLEDEEEDSNSQPLNRKRESQAALISNPKKARGKGPIHSYFQMKPEAVVERRKQAKMRQTNIDESLDKERRATAIQYIAKFFYQAGNAFNQVNLDSFKYMIEAIGQYGPNLKPPSYHEMRVTLLKKEVTITEELLKKHKAIWATQGCSIMSDGWTSKTGQTIINFLVNSSMGSAFIESVDASSYSKTGDKTFELLNAFVDKIGEENVIQVITDNGSNFKKAGRLLEAERPHLYWTPCAAHCLDLMLEDIGKIRVAAKTIKEVSNLTRFIYNHQATLSLMRQKTKGANLVRPAITRFATHYLSLKSIHKQKKALRSMILSETWCQSPWSRDRKAKEVKLTILKPSFWNNVLWILKVMGPLVRVLRLVDNEKKPAMGYIYEAMDRAKETIQASFHGKEEKYKEVFKIIDDRWECQLHQPLHAAAHLLNPEYFYSNPQIQFDSEVMDGFHKCVERLVRDNDEKNEITDELLLYENAKGIFESPAAIRARKKKPPAEWWTLFGASAPNLQRLAIKILSLTCSASGCERNWSVFEQLHSPRRNKLQAKTLNDLVFVKYNQALKARYDNPNTEGKITLDDIDESNEWLADFGEKDDEDAENDEFVLSDDDEGQFGTGLTYGLIGAASGAEEPARATRMQSRRLCGSSVPSSSRNSKTKNKSVSQRDSFEEMETNVNEYETDEEEIYKSDNEDEEDEDLYGDEDRDEDGDEEDD